MPKTYELAPEDVAARANKLRSKFHKELDKAGVTISYLFARAEDGTAVQCAGYPALAVIRIVNLKDRAKGNADAEMTIDADRFVMMTGVQQDGLLDHELEHIIVKCDDEGAVLFDDQNRPKLKLRKHDYQVGWFTNIAQRHGMDSVEVTQARLLWAEDGQSYFPFLTDKADIEAQVIP